MKKTTICQGCWEQMHVPIPIRGPFSILFRPFGIKKSQMHPNLCTICESMFTKVKKRKQISIDATILFADLRGYTSLSQQLDPVKVNELLHCFYDQCSAAVWEQEGIINKFIGDAALAIFNFPLQRKDHVTNAVNAAIDLQKKCKDLTEKIGLSKGQAPGIGIGIHTGKCYLGEVGTSYKDFTAIGAVVNLASRLQAAAGAGEILLTADVFDQVKGQFPDAQLRTLSLKGLNDPVIGYAIHPAA
jgi:adenylate cyclase